MNMPVSSHAILLIVFMSGVTYLPRLIPLLFLSGRKLPLWLEEWLGFIPPAILSAIIVPSLVVNGSTGHFDLLSRELIVALPTLVFALKTRSLGGTVLVGMALYWIAGWFCI